MTAAPVQRVVRGVVVEQLSSKERRRLEADEAIIQSNLGAFQEVGQALADIRDNKLYRETHETFASYCKMRWDLAQSRAYQQIWAVEAIRYVRDNSDTDQVPKNERIARELGSLMRQDKETGPAQMLEAWSIALEAAGPEKAPTTEIVRDAVRKVRYQHSGYYSENGETTGPKVIPGDLFRDVGSLARKTKRALEKTELPDPTGLAHLDPGWREKVLADIEDCVKYLDYWRKQLVDSRGSVDEAATPRRRSSS